MRSPRGPALSCPQRRRLARAGLLVAAVAVGSTALTVAASSAAAVAPVGVTVVLPGPVATGHAPLHSTVPAPRAAGPARRNPFAERVTAPAPGDAEAMTPEEAARIAPPAPPFGRAGRNPFRALVVAGAASSTAPPAPSGPGDRLLLLGTTGEDVRVLQTQLVASGADLAVDGTYGPQTVAAVTAFQRRHALRVDGITGPQTRAALRTP